jgi:hypothetical protein
LSAAARESERLRDRLAEIEMEHATLRSELSAFESEYLRRVGVIDVQLQEAQAKLFALTGDRAGAAAAQQRYHETTRAMQAVPPPPGPPPSEDVKTLFRDAAKRMHPDLQRDAAGRGHAEAFMKRLNEAYAGGDVDAIGNLVRQWETSPYATGEPSTRGAPAPALVAAVAQAEQRLDQARETQLARLMEQVFQASMTGRDLLAELHDQATVALADARARLKAVGG